MSTQPLRLQPCDILALDKHGVALALDSSWVRCEPPEQAPESLMFASSDSGGGSRDTVNLALFSVTADRSSVPGVTQALAEHDENSQQQAITQASASALSPVISELKQGMMGEVSAISIDQGGVRATVTAFNLIYAFLGDVYIASMTSTVYGQDFVSMADLPATYPAWKIGQSDTLLSAPALYSHGKLVIPRLT